jgi:hypothetical protein
VGPESKIALRQDGLRQKGNGNGNQAGKEREGSAPGIEPHDARNGEDELEEDPRQISAELGQEAEMPDHVASIRHVGAQPALEITVAEAGELLEKGDPKTSLEMTPEPEEGRHRRKLEEEQCRGKEHDGGHRSQSLTAQAEVSAEVEERAKEKCLN